MMNIKGLISKVGFGIQKHSPELLIGAGVVGFVGTVVLACRATLKVDAVLDETKETLNKIHEAEKVCPESKYSKDDVKKDKTTAYIQTGLKLAKLYGPAIITGVTSTVCILSAHNILKKRYLGMTAAYAALDTTFKGYRDRVKERFGDEVEYQLMHNIKAEEIEEKTVDENGEEKIEKKTINTVKQADEYSVYSRVFDNTSEYYTDDPEYNRMFLKKVCQSFNDKLNIMMHDQGVGRIFINDVYKALGFQTTKYGQMIGWVKDPNDPLTKDTYIDFGLYNKIDTSEASRRFINGYEPCVILDFNVTGNVWENMP